MTKVRFYRFVPYEDGMMGQFELSGDDCPINIFIDNATEYLDTPECDAEVDVCGVFQELEVFKDVDEYFAGGLRMAPTSMIPTGTFSVGGDQTGFQQSPTISYSGIVKKVEKDERAAKDSPNYCMTIKTYGLTFRLYARYDGQIEEGYIVSGSAWLFGNMRITKGSGET